MGGTLARRLAAPEALTELAAETGAVPVPITEAGRDAKVLIIAIPQENVPDLPRGILDALPDGPRTNPGAPIGACACCGTSECIADRRCRIGRIGGN